MMEGFNNKKENDPADNLKKNISKLQEEMGNVDENRLNPEQKSAFLKIKKRILKVSGRVAKTIGYLSIIGSTLGVVNYERTHSDLEILTNPDGTHVYKHEDERTTHLLNVLAGTEKFTEEDLRTEYNAVFKNAFEENDIPLEKDIEEMTIDELDAVVVPLLNKQVKIDQARIGDFKKIFYEEIHTFNESNGNFERNKNIYELVWQMEQECGNPEIRFFSENPYQRGFSDIKGKQHYVMFNNTIYISPWDMKLPRNFNEAHLIAEMSHAKQFNDDQIGPSLNFIFDQIGVLKRSKFDKESLHAENEALYHRPGSVEHEAHSVIEPYLKGKYPLFIKNENKKDDHE